MGSPDLFVPPEDNVETNGLSSAGIETQASIKSANKPKKKKTYIKDKDSSFREKIKIQIYVVHRGLARIK